MSNKDYINENFDLKALKKIGFLENVKDYVYIEKRIITYFGLDYIQQYSDLPPFGTGITKYIKAENIFSSN